MAVNINELTDEQKSWATLLPYLQINEEGREKLERGETIKLSEFEQYLEGPDEIWSKRGEILAQMGDASLVNEDAFLTRKELLDKFNELGLGDLELKDFSEEKGVLTTGFQACAFQDSQGQSAVVFRGSDFDFSHGAIDDWLHANVLEFVRGTSRQQDEALAYFDKWKDPDGQTWVGGSSLGGNLASHVFCERTDEISQAFMLNANPINGKRIDTPEKQEAFNDPERYSFNCIAGDVVSHLKSHDAFAGGVTYIHNNGTQPDTFLGAHLPQSAAFDKDGNFIEASKEEVRKYAESGRGDFARFLNDVRDGLNAIEDRIQNGRDELNDAVQGVRFALSKEGFDQFREKLRQDLSEGIGKLLGREQPEIEKQPIGKNMEVSPMAQTNGNGVNMHELNDEQKTWLTQMSYLNINEEGRKKLERGESIKVSELDQYLDAPDKPWCGNGGFGNKIANFASQVVVNRDAFETQGEMVEKLNQLGLGDIEITNASKEHQFGDSGFQALTFKDSYDNVGISFRGSDLDAGRGYMDDWIRADLGEFTKGDSQQMRDALKYFDQNKDQNGQTMVFGHSLGGQLSSHVLCERTDEVKQAFVINANPINSNRLDTPEKQAAFNDPEKYSFNAVAGDLVSHFKAHHGYEGNVNYVSNNHSQPNNIVGAHVVQAASFDKNGNFIKATPGEVEQEMGGMRGEVAKFMNNLRDRLNDWEQKVQEDPGIVGHVYRAAKTHEEASIQAKETFKDFRQDFREAVSGGFGEMLNKMHLDKERLQEKGRSIAEGFQKVGQSIGIEDIGRADIDGFTMVGGAVGGIGGAVLGHEIGESIGDALQQDGLLEGFEMPDIMKSAQDMLQDIEQRMDIPGIDMQALAHEAQDLIQDIGNNNVIQDIGETFEQGLSELGDFVNDIGDEVGLELGD